MPLAVCLPHRQIGPAHRAHNAGKGSGLPELPEVETVRRGLQPHLEGQRIARAEARVAARSGYSELNAALSAQN